ncbi:hypothetical protein Tco_0617653 [Tanacetum coccineum]
MPPPVLRESRRRGLYGGPHPNTLSVLLPIGNTLTLLCSKWTSHSRRSRIHCRVNGDPELLRASNQMGPLGFPLPNVQNNQNYNRDVKAITPEVGVAYDGPMISTYPFLLEGVERENQGDKGQVDYDVDHRVPLILGRPLLRTARALIDVHGKELTLESMMRPLRLNSGTLRDTPYYYDETVHQVDVIDIACEEYAQEVLGFSNSSKSGNPTLSLDPIITTSSPSFTPFKGGDFVLEEIEACLSCDSFHLELMICRFDPERPSSS